MQFQYPAAFHHYINQAFPQDICKLLTFSIFTTFFGVKFCFICKISPN